MNAKEFCATAEKLKLSQLSIAAVLGVVDRTTRRYMSGETAVPEPTAKLLRLALKGKITVRDIENA